MRPFLKAFPRLTKTVVLGGVMTLSIALALAAAVFWVRSESRWDLLSGTRMRVLLQELREQFDIIVLDTPPVLATADAGIVASLTDGVLLVVRAGATDRNAAQRACQQLANVGARVIGTVLNDPGGEVAKEGDYYYPYDYAAEEQ